MRLNSFLTRLLCSGWPALQFFYAPAALHTRWNWEMFRARKILRMAGCTFRDINDFKVIAVYDIPNLVRAQ